MHFSHPLVGNSYGGQVPKIGTTECECMRAMDATEHGWSSEKAVGVVATY